MNFKNLMMCLAILAVTFTSCKDDPVPIENVKVVSIEANGTSFEDGSAVTSNLNGSSAAMDVALNSTITVTFDKNIDPATANGAVTLTSDNGSVAGGVNSTATTLTIDPTNDLERGTTYTLTISGIKAEDTGDFTEISRSFTTEGRATVVPPNSDNQIAYFNFDGTVDDQTATFGQVDAIDVAFGEDRFGQGNSTASFDGNTSIIEIMGGDQMMASNDFTLSFWMKTNSEGHVNENGDPASHFIFGLGAFFGFQIELRSSYNSFGFPVSYVAEDDSTMYTYQINVEGAGDDGANETTFDADLGETGVADLVMDKWAHLLYSYNASTKVGTFFINGTLLRSFDFNLMDDCDAAAPLSCIQKTKGVAYRGNPADVEPILALGFIKSADSPMWNDTPWGDYYTATANHFKGDLDDIRVFSAPYSEADAKALYDAEK